jgi:pimeloyl-ACP methyl ester carboxylesterase
VEHRCWWVPIHYLEADEGPPLVLLDALGESAFDWRWVLPTLAHTNHIYVPDLPGFGYSAKPYAEYSPDFFARFVSAYLEALSVDRTAVVGNSISGHAALRFALSEPARITALGLVASADLGREITYALRLPASPNTARRRSPGERRLWAPSKELGRGCRFSSDVPNASSPNG